ncbi:hypothetical protein LJC03_05150, partial [Methanobrevibacter sp. OttesenSCG-928-I08]|nr:hypothetical protein [Methanobrevibacter sp. OttesenSCG-928-I08]
SSVSASDNFTSLQSQINSSVSGNEIVLTDNVNLENDEYFNFANGILIDVDNITINGNGYTINGTSQNGYSTRIFNIASNNVIIKNITLTGANIYTGSYYNITEGGAIYNTGNNIELQNVNLINNSADYGGAIFNLEGSNFKIVDSIFENNVAYMYGGAILNNEGDNFLITGFNIFRANLITWYSGGAIANNGTNFRIEGNNLFEDNNGSINGGAIVNNGTNFTIIGENSFINNTAGYGGAILNIANNFKIIGNNAFKSNIANRFGGVLYNEANDILIEGNNLFEGNNVLINGKYEGGAVIYNIGNNFKIKENNIFKSNQANNSCGGVIYNVGGDDFTIQGTNTFENNIALFGGVITNDYTNNFTIIGENSFINNSAEYGGAIYLYFSNNTIFSDGSFIKNKADSGGAMVIDRSINVTITKNNFVNNFADYGAGFESHISNLIITDNNFQNNEALITGNDIYSGEDSLYLNNNKMTEHVNIFLNNTNITSKTYLIFLNNSTINTGYKNINLTAVLTDDMGNIIIGPNVTFTINNEIFTSNNTLEDGTYYFDYTPKNLGTFIVSGDTNLENLTIKTGLLNVLGLWLEADDIVMYYKNGTQYVVNLISYNGSNVSNKTIYITVNGKTYEKITNENGTAFLNINLNPGSYTITAHYNETSNLTISTSLEVLSTIKSNDLVKYYRNDSQYTVTILDKEGKPLSKSNITFSVNGVIYTKTTNENGTATLNINLNPGGYIITVKDENGLEVSNSIRVLPTLLADNLFKYYGDPKPYETIVLDGHGNRLANQTVSININGIIYNKTSDNFGIAKLDINLNPGSYIATSTYNGYSLISLIIVSEI